jgi:hypothetical protein
MVTADGRVKIADFGIAKATTGLRTGTFLTAAGTTLGTPSYMAPEQAMALAIGPWTDLYSLGCMAYEMVTGGLPFADTESPLAILLRHVHERPASAASVDPAVDRRVSDWIDRLLRKEPGARPRSAAAAWRQLEEIVVAIEGPEWARTARLIEPSPATSDPRESGEYESYVAPPARPPDSRAERPSPAPPAFATTVAPDEAPERESAPDARQRSRLDTIGAIGVVVLVVALGAAALIAHAGGGPRAGGQLAAGALRVQPPPGWAEVPRPRALPGIELAHALAVAPRGGPKRAGGALIGFAPRSARRESLLAVELTDALGTEPDGDRVRLRAGRLDALRYRGLRPRAVGRSVTVYAVPTSAGVATLACVAPAKGGERFEADCRRLADSLTLRGATAFPLGPSRAYADALNHALDRLERVLDEQSAALGGARLAVGQAEAATAIGAAYGEARAALARIDISPADEATRAALLRALRATRSGYRGLAAAARTGDGVRYGTATARVQDGERRLERGIRALSGGAYAALVPARRLSRPVPPLTPYCGLECQGP